MSFESKFRNFVGRLQNGDFTQIELSKMGDELLRQYNEERKENISGWHGKSSFELVTVGDNIIVTKFQKPERGAEPKEVKTIISVQELRNLMASINFLWSRRGDKDCIKSTEVGQVLYHTEWDNIFKNRKVHNKFTIMLNVLDKKEIIEYTGGRVRVK